MSTEHERDENPQDGGSGTTDPFLDGGHEHHREDDE